MKTSITNTQLFNMLVIIPDTNTSAIDALLKLDFPVRTARDLIKLRTVLIAEYKTFEEARGMILEKYKNDISAMRKELDDLFTLTVEVEHPEISFTQIENQTIKPVYLEILDWLIKE